MSNLIIEANKTNLDKVIEFVNGELMKLPCTDELKTKLNIAVEEIFVNISSYAYNEHGEVEINCNVNKDDFMFEVEFKDMGKPYDPLERTDPDISKGIDEREIGGLGIFMTKQFMDDIEYRYEGNKNVLIIRKKIK